jgi:hypothetical protein
MKIIKIIFIIILFVLAYTFAQIVTNFYLVIKFHNLEKTHLVIGVPKAYYAIPIPKEILEAKDCKKLRDWAYDAKSGVWFVYFKFKCPWAVNEKGVMGTFIMDGITFKIDRGLLLFSHLYDDGEIDKVSLEVKIQDGQFVYPDIYPRDNTWISIFSKKSFSEHHAYAKDYNYDPILTQFNYLNTRAINNKVRFHLIEKNIIPGLMLYSGEYLVDDYWVKQYFYIAGSIEKPDYWAVCPKQNKENSECETIVKLNDKIYLNYRFNRLRYEKQQFEYRDLIINQVKKFIEK